MAYDPELAARIRGVLAAQPAPVREVGMFGGLSFLVNERIALTANKDGDLMLRVDPADVDDFLRQGAGLADMGKGRRMSKGWIVVSATALRSDADLHRWLAAALAHNRSTGGTAEHGR